MSGKDFDGVADTLYIPLAARVYVSKRFPEYFFDPKSLELEAAISWSRGRLWSHSPSRKYGAAMPPRSPVRGKPPCRFS